MEGETKKGLFPVGVIFGVFTKLQTYDGVPEIILVNAEWFPWASNRNKMECMTKVLTKLRDDYFIKFYSSEKDKDFYVHIMRQGILRRVGHIHGFFKDGDAIEFEGVR